VHKLIVNGDPGIWKGAVVEYDGSEYVCFSVTRQGEFSGPERPQLCCIMGEPGERDRFERRAFLSMHLVVEAVDADELTVHRSWA